MKDIKVATIQNLLSGYPIYYFPKREDLHQYMAQFCKLIKQIK